jgi:hypothetical protein
MTALCSTSREAIGAPREGHTLRAIVAGNHVQPEATMVQRPARRETHHVCSPHR